ncbi:MAG: hypothetical protein PHR35_16255 [Kiritimatiellae bacterium]|nr:hypothetical protein [Kiritimatiellia bacterium]
MTPRERVERALRGELTDKVPFTIYEGKIPQCEAEREMRNRGMCIVQRLVPAYVTHQPNVKVASSHFVRDGKSLIRTCFETPVGTVSTLSEPAGFTSWTHERMFKRPEDYKVIKFMVEDQRFEPCYDQICLAQERGGGDIIFRTGFGLEPLQSLISGVYMDMATFCVEWMDHRDELLAIYHAIAAKHREVYPLVAASPCLHANYGGNVVPEVIGVDNFKTYYVPHYNEAAEIMHRHGKLIGCHFDANCGPLKEAIASTDLDYIEAFTPSPDTDMTLGEARAAWPAKTLWLNFPSSVHLRPDAEVERTTVELLDQVSDPRGILMGITEDIPEDRWRDSCRAIMSGLERHARNKPALYSPC